MQQKECSLGLYVDFLIASRKQYSGVELSKVAPEEMAHDAVSRWLRRTRFIPKVIRQYASSTVNPKAGYLIIADLVLDKPYSRIIPLVKAQVLGEAPRHCPWNRDRCARTETSPVSPRTICL